jgi:hypothetical protein
MSVRKFCGEIAKMVKRESIKVEKITRNINKIVEICKYFAFVV